MAATEKSDLHAEIPLWSAKPRMSVHSHKYSRCGHYDIVVGATIIRREIAIPLSVSTKKLGEQVAVTPDGLPIKCEVPGPGDVSSVMGFASSGITFTQIAFEIASARIAGRSDPDEDVFRAPLPGSARHAA